MGQANGPMVSEVSICNQALGWLGAKRISGFSENSVPAKLCRDNYPVLRDALLESRMWTFASFKDVSESATTDGWGEWFIHPILDEYLSVFRVYRRVSEGNMVRDDAWYREGDNIVSERPTIYFSGIKRMTDSGKFSPMFVQALAARIAADLAIPLTENRQLQADMWNLYQAKLMEATTRDGQQAANERFAVGSMITSRRAGRYGVGR